MRDDTGVPVVNSRDVAETFGKEHSKVLRDIRDLEIEPNLARSWFRQSSVSDSYGREQPSFDLTRDGFTLLVMGFTGERAMAPPGLPLKPLLDQAADGLGTCRLWFGLRIDPIVQSIG